MKLMKWLDRHFLVIAWGCTFLFFPVFFIISLYNLIKNFSPPFCLLTGVTWLAYLLLIWKGFLPDFKDYMEWRKRLQ